VSRLYLDACTIIYLIEGSKLFREAAARRLLVHRTHSEAVLISSFLSRLECRVLPLREENHELLATYDAFFSADRLSLMSVSPEIIERATWLRAKHRFKTPDALHLSTAIESEADVFLTGDQELSRCEEIKVEVLEPTASL
jgi:predicted nucleic acid-binding protein